MSGPVAVVRPEREAAGPLTAAPRVSVVMPVHDVAPFVEEAVCSLLRQTYRDFELIVVDDGSTDGSGDLVAAIPDPRIRLVRAPHVGLVRAENLGLRLARGELVMRADGDDLYLSTLLERLVETLDAHPTAAGAGAWSRQFGARQRVLRTPAEPRAIRRRLRVGCTISQPVLVRAEVLREVGGYRDVVWEDWDLWVRIAARWDLRCVQECLSLYRYRPGSLSRRGSRLARARANLRARLAAARALGVDLRSALRLARSLAVLPLHWALDLVGVPPPGAGEDPADRPPTVSVVVPTFRRPALLARCLEGVEAQRPRADEVVVVHRPEDAESAAFLETWVAGDPARRRAVAVEGPGLVRALAAGTEAARGEVLAYLDDDAVPRPGWLEELLRGFLDPTVGAVGGRFVDHVDGRAVEGRTGTVGRVTWYGRVIGRHELETEHYGDVEFLGGANWAVRREVAYHDPRLLVASTGLVLANELDSCLTVRRLGRRVLYTPWAVVDHYTTSYRDPELGSRVSGDDVVTSAANYTYALLKYLPLPRRAAFLVYAFAVGSSTLPGPLRVAVEAVRDRRRAAAMARRIGATWRGRREGIRMYRAWRAEAPGRPGRQA